MNDLPVKANVVVPLINRPRVRGVSLKLVTRLTGWDLDLSMLQDWHHA